MSSARRLDSPAMQSEWEFETWRQIHAGADAAELLLAGFGNLVDGVVDGSRNHVLGHLRIVGDQLAIDPHAAHFMAAGHGDLHHAAAGAAGHFEFGDFFLRALQVFLHALRLLHQLSQLSFHACLPAGRMLSGMIWAPSWRCMSWMIGSSASARSAAACSSERALAARVAGVSATDSCTIRTRNLRPMASPSWSCNCLHAVSLLKMACSDLTAKVKMSPSNDFGTACCASWPAGPPNPAAWIHTSQSARPLIRKVAGLGSGGCSGASATPFACFACDRGAASSTSDATRVTEEPRVGGATRRATLSAPTEPEPPRNANMRNKAISNPDRTSGASGRSRRPCKANWYHTCTSSGSTSPASVSSTSRSGSSPSNPDTSCRSWMRCNAVASCSSTTAKSGDKPAMRRSEERRVGKECRSAWPPGQ